MPSLADAMTELPLVAVLRGVRPEEVDGVAGALIEAGVRILEIPMNSPRPLESLARLARFADRIVYGAGTVLSPDAVVQVARAGGTMVVSPNTDVAVIGEAVGRRLTPVPGFATASEAFAGYGAGARHLKLFPAATYGVGHLKALLDVLPKAVTVMPFGGVKSAQFAQWWAAGARGFGLGGEIYTPGAPPETIGERAAGAVEALKAVMGQAPESPTI